MNKIGQGNPTPQEKQNAMFETWLNGQKLDFPNPEADKAYHDRVRMIRDVVQLREPSRVPVYANVGFFPAYYAGITTEQSMYDYNKLSSAWTSYVMDFEPDVHGGAATPGPGKSFELLDYKLYLWPGHGTDCNAPYQCLETDYMKANEYDDLIRDPSDFMMRKYMPRIFGKLAGFEKIGGLGALLQMPYTGTFLAPFGRPDMKEGLEALIAAGEEAILWRRAVSACNRNLQQSGFPLISGGATLAPYDAIADTFRGTRGVINDIYRQPDKLLAAMESMLPVLVELGAESARAIGRPLIFIPLHKGADSFMSDRHYREFYWPTLKKMIGMFADQGLVPFLFAEGSYTSRLGVIEETPVGTSIWHFDDTDMALAKHHLKGISCICGNVPISLLSTGTTTDVENYCRKLIDTAGKGGGFIMASGAVIDTAKPENVRTMIQFTREYGIYP